MVEAAGVEPASLTNLPAATTCLAGEILSATRFRSDNDPGSLASRDFLKPMRADAARAPACCSAHPS